MDFFFMLTAVFILTCYSGFSRRWPRALTAPAVTSAARLKRIQNASLWIQLLMVIGFVVAVYSLLAFFLGWPIFSQSHVRIVVSQHHIYESPSDMPVEVLICWLIKMAWGGFGYGVMFLLFGLYRRGILFSAKNSWHIRSLGYYLIGDWGLDSQLQSTVRDVQLSSTPLFIGLLIIFVSWIMDEGRKIQEEQELTV